MSIKRKSPGIDASLVLFEKPGAIPAKIDLKEEQVQLELKIPGFVTALSGHQRLDSLMYARQYADSKKREMVVIDIRLGYDLPLYPKVLGPEEVVNHDVLNLFRVSKQLVSELAAMWEGWMRAHEPNSNVGWTMDWARPADFVARRPQYIANLLETDGFKHINIVTHPVMAEYAPSGRPVTATSFRIGYPKIERAGARFHPEIEIAF